MQPGWPPHVYKHIAEALERSLGTLIGYEGAGKVRGVSTHTSYEPWPLPEPPKGPTP